MTEGVEATTTPGQENEEELREKEKTFDPVLKSWDELAEVQKLERLRNVVRMQTRALAALSEQVRRLSSHRHNEKGTAVNEQQCASAYVPSYDVIARDRLE